MKVLHVIPNLGIGGTEKNLWEVCRGLESGSFKNIVVSLKSGGATADALGQIPVPVTLLGASDRLLDGVLNFARLHSHLKNIISQVSPDIVHTWLSRANVMGRLAANGSRAPVISSLRVMEAEKTYHLWAETWTHRWSRVVTVNCTALQQFAIEKLRMPPEKVALIPNGIAPAETSADPAEISVFKKKWSKEGEWLVGTMGRLHPQKGIDIFLQAIPPVLERFPSSRFLIAGDGPEKEKLRALAKKLKIDSRVHFCGWVKSAEFLTAIDLFVLSSRWEGMPNAVMEAMLLKKPVIATSVGGTPDLIEHGKEGFLIEPEDVASCAEAILNLTEDDLLRQELSRAGQKKIMEQFSMQRMIESYRKLYESLAG